MIMNKKRIILYFLFIIILSFILSPNMAIGLMRGKALHYDYYKENSVTYDIKTNIFWISNTWYNLSFTDNMTSNYFYYYPISSDNLAYYKMAIRYYYDDETYYYNFQELIKRTTISTCFSNDSMVVIYMKFATPNYQLFIDVYLIVDDAKWFGFYIYVFSNYSIPWITLYAGADLDMEGESTGDYAVYSSSIDAVYQHKEFSGDLFLGFSSTNASYAHHISEYSDMWSAIDDDNFNNADSYSGDAGIAMKWRTTELLSSKSVMFSVLWAFGSNFSDFSENINYAKQYPFTTFFDSDHDGLSDYDEIKLGTNPRDPDTDGDGMPDGWEVQYGLNATYAEDAGQDLDNDGLTNLEEYQYHTNPRDPDTDGDGMPDDWEVQYGLNPVNQTDAYDDLDGDGLTNLEEYQYHTVVNDSDTDNDNMPDGWEIQYGLNATYAGDAGQDLDGDGLTNLQEYVRGLDPTNPDTDGDGMPDGIDFLPAFNNIPIYVGVAIGVFSIVLLILKIKKKHKVTEILRT